MTDSQRNVLILVAIAIIVAATSGHGGALALGGASALLGVLFRMAIIAFVIVTYQQRSGTIALMQSTPRLILQVCVAGIVLLLTLPLIAMLVAIPSVAANPAVYWPALFLCAFGIWWSWQQRTTGW
jgi:hypothetical protein